jgi:hypothetical protein
MKYTSFFLFVSSFKTSKHSSLFEMNLFLTHSSNLFMKYLCKIDIMNTKVNMHGYIIKFMIYMMVSHKGSVYDSLTKAHQRNHGF